MSATLEQAIIDTATKMGSPSKTCNMAPKPLGSTVHGYNICSLYMMKSLSNVFLFWNRIKAAILYGMPSYGLSSFNAYPGGLNVPMIYYTSATRFKLVEQTTNLCLQRSPFLTLHFLLCRQTPLPQAQRGLQCLELGRHFGGRGLWAATCPGQDQLGYRCPI